MNTEQLKILMKKKNVNAEALADAIGMDTSTFYRKLSADGETFSVKQANEIVCKLSLSKKDALSIFFGS